MLQNTIFFMWFILMLSVILSIQSFLLTLLVIEIMSFLSLMSVSIFLNSEELGNFFILIIFTIFIIEGVIGLIGFILLVNTVGSDYLSSNSILKL